MARARLIPAHAGKTDGPRHRRRPALAHPRSRGENLELGPDGVPCGGSSPLTRGKRRRPRRRDRRNGLIPAHAGKTPSRRDRRRLRTAHPRSRGENVASTAARNVSLGSSPLTRGKRWEKDRWNDPGGLIPAHAGKTLTRAVASSIVRAHPRSRGENRDRQRDRDRSAGSSPLTRGKLDRRVKHVRGDGLIPAHAGKTAGDRLPEPPWRAHPRSRGEN